MNSVKVSIIIPVYNAKDYIEKCLKSILNQSLKEIEIIAVNDGSSDESLNILKKISQKDKRLIVLSQENKGASAARNLGIRNANGEYIGFVDIDDYIEEDMYSKMYNKAIEKDYDIITCSFKEEGRNYTINFTDSLFGNDELLGDNIKKIYLEKIVEDKFLGYLPLWNKIFKNKLIKEKKIVLNENMVLGEDRVFCCEAFFYANKVGNINEVLYHYVKINSDSLTKKYNIKQIEYYLQDRSSMFEFVKSNVKEEKLTRYKSIYNERIFYKLLDYALIQSKTKDKLRIKYKNIKYIFSLQEMKNAYDTKIYKSNSTKVLINLSKYKIYILVYIMIYIKATNIKNRQRS